MAYPAAKDTCSGYAKEHERKLLDCIQPWRDADRGPGELALCKVAIARLDAGRENIRKDHQTWIGEDSEKLASLKARLKAMQDKVKALDAGIALIKAPIAQALSRIGKLAGETR